MRRGIGLLLLFIGGCAANIIYSSKGEELYYEKCGGCHRLHSKQEYSKEKWLKEMEEMGRKSKLDSDERRMIIEYLTGLENKTAAEK